MLIKCVFLLLSLPFVHGCVQEVCVLLVVASAFCGAVGNGLEFTQIGSSVSTGFNGCRELYLFSRPLIEQ